jgi:hypothetical protein
MVAAHCIKRDTNLIRHGSLLAALILAALILAALALTALAWTPAARSF